MTVDGRLYDSTTPEDPLLDNSVLMKIQILNPAKTCILYEEEQTVSTLSSNGYFNVRVGSPTAGAESLKRTTATIDVGNSMMEVFQNQNASIPGKTAGGAGCGYIPAAGDTRYFRFVVTPSTTAVTSTLSPDMQIDSVPQSLVAETLQGMTPSNFVQTNTDVTQAKVNTLFGASYAGLTGLLAGSSSLYLQNTTNGTVIPNRATNPASPTAGQIWYDSDDFVLRYYDGTSVLTLGTSGGDPTKLPLAGGTMSGAIDMATNDITDIGHMTQAAQRTFRFGVYTTAQQATLVATPLVAGHEGTVWYNTTTNKLMFWDGTAESAVSPVDSVFGRTGAVVAAASDYDAVQIDNTPAGAVAAVTAQAAIDELDSEKVAKAGDTMTGQLNMGPRGVAAGDGGAIAFTELAAGGTNTATVRAPDALGANYVLTLPANDGDSGQYLQTDGNGILAWVTPAGVGETNTASNQGVGGVGVYDAKSGVDLQFRNINAASNKVSVALDAANKEVDINVNEANLDLASIPNTPAGTIAATNAQAAINELDSEKVATARAINTAANSGLAGGGDLSADRSLSVNITGTTAETAVAGTDEILIYDASATALRKMARTNFVLSETEVDAMVSNNGYLSAEVDTLATVTGRGATTATSITLNTQAQARFADSAGGEYAAIQAPATIGANYVLTLPDSAGANGQVLSTNGSGVLSWIAIPSAPVTTVFGRTGAVLAVAGDYTAAQVTNVAGGSVAAVTVQAAIDELDAEKVAKTGDSVSGAITFATQNQARFADSAGGEYAAIQAPTTIGANYVLTLPDTAGSASQVLTTNGAGVLSWTTPSTVPAANSLDFTHFVDAMTLDASTDIAVTGTRVFSITNSGTGNSFLVNDVASDTSPFVIDQSGSVGIGTTAPEFSVHNVTPIADSTPSYVVDAQGNTASTGPAFIGRRARDSAGTPSALQTGDVIAVFGARGYIGGSWATGSSASIAMTAQENFTGSARGTAIDFQTTALGSNGRTTKMYLTGDGSLGLGTTGPATLLDVAGAITSRPNGTGTGQTGQLILRELAVGGSEAATLRAPDAITTSYVLTLPTSAGSSGQLLQTDGTGVLSWVTAAAAVVDDSLSFDKFADSMTLDVSTDISATGTNVFSITNSGTGDSLRVNDEAADASPFVITAAGNVGIGTTTPANRLSVQDGGISISGDMSVTDPQININPTDNLTFYTNTVDERKLRMSMAASADTTFGYQIAWLNNNGTQRRVGALYHKDGDVFFPQGSLAVGKTFPTSRLDVAGAITSRPNGTGTGQTGQILMLELLANGAHSATIRAPDSISANYTLTLPGDDGTNGQVLQTNGSGVLSWVSSVAPAADSLDFTHFSDTMSLDDSTDIAASGTNVLSLTNTGTGNSFVVNDVASDATPFVIDQNGNVGIGTTAPRASLDVNGAITSKASLSVASTTVNYLSNNLAHTTQNCQAYALWNLKDGANYTFAVQGTSSSTCSFTAFSDAGVTPLAVRLPPGHSATYGTFQTLYSFVVLGTTVFVAWVTGY